LEGLVDGGEKVFGQVWDEGCYACYIFRDVCGRETAQEISAKISNGREWAKVDGGVAALQSSVKLGICRHLERTVGRAYHMLRALFLRLTIQDCDGD